jgi:hypothetical protein
MWVVRAISLVAYVVDSKTYIQVLSVCYTCSDALNKKNKDNNETGNKPKHFMISWRNGRGQRYAHQIYAPEYFFSSEHASHAVGIMQV